MSATLARKDRLEFGHGLAWIDYPRAASINRHATMKRPLMSGFRGVVIYIVAGVTLTYILNAQIPGSGNVVGLIFLLSTAIAIPWIAGRASKK